MNSVNLENVAHEKAVSALKGVADDAVLLLQPSVSLPERFSGLLQFHRPDKVAYVLAICMLVFH